MSNNDLIIVYVTCPPADSEKIAEVLINEKLAACVNILPAKSIYIWEDKLCRDEESLLIIKSTLAAYPELEAKVKQIHPYNVPEIVAIKVEAVQYDYLKWVHGQTKKQ